MRVHIQIFFEKCHLFYLNFEKLLTTKNLLSITSTYTDIRFCMTIYEKKNLGKIEPMKRMPSLRAEESHVRNDISCKENTENLKAIPSVKRSAIQATECEHPPSQKEW